MKKQEEGKKGTMKGRKERMRRRRKRALPDNPGNPFKCKGGKKNNVKCKVTWLLTPKGTALKVGTKVRMCVVRWGHSEPTWTVVHLELNQFTHLRLHVNIQMYMARPCSKVRIQTLSFYTLTTPGWHMNDLLGLHPIPPSLRTPKMLLRMLSHLFIISFSKMPLLQNLQMNYNLLSTQEPSCYDRRGFLMRAVRRKDVFCQVKLKANQHPSELNRSEPPREGGLQ